MPANPFDAVIDACGTATHSYSPDDALRVIDWYRGMPDLIEAVAQMLTAQGAKTTEEFYLHPAAGQFAMGLGDQLRLYSEACHAARAAFERAHAADLDRIRNPRPHEAKWNYDPSGAR